MYSQCPECLTRFRVTAAALRAAHGTVRCGRCGSAFDALPRLSDTLHDAHSAADPVPPAGREMDDIAVATAAGLLSPAERAEVTEFQFSADDIENVFIDVRDWQSRFGASSSPGDRAGKLGDTSSAELERLLESAPADDLEDGATEAAGSKVWVHEPESIEDITLEGERIQIEGLAGFEEDFLEREIENELEEQYLAEITGSQRVLAPDDTDAVVDDAVPLAGIEPLHDLDSTDRFEILRDVPESTDPRADPVAAVPAMPAAVAATAAALALRSSPAVPALSPLPAGADAPAAPAAAQPAPPVAPWRRFPEPAAATAADEHEHDPQLAEELAAAAGMRGSGWAWGLGAFVLALLLSAQVVHQFRLQLARDANLGPVLREVYARLGQPLPPNWNLAAFELRQWGANEAAPTAAGTMTVRASIRNRASFAQPMPLLRLELEDRFGSTVARRDFSPREYLKDPAQAGRLLRPGTATEAELVVVEATAEAVGYRLDVCLRQDAGILRCAQNADTAASPSQAPQ